MRAAGAERGELEGMAGGLGDGLGWVENGCGAAPRSTSAFPGNIPAPWPCQHGGASWLRAPTAALLAGAGGASAAPRAGTGVYMRHKK